MGFMDKVKSQANVIAEKAQEGAKAGQERISQLQAKRQADALLLELGGIVYLQRSERPEPTADARIEEILAKLREYETQYGLVTVTSASSQ